MSDILKSAMNKTDECGVRNLRGPLVLNHGEHCEGCKRVANDVIAAQGGYRFERPPRGFELDDF